LLASNMVDLASKTDTVSPILAASIAPIDNKQIRVRGGLAAVDIADSDYTVNVDPFHDHDGGKLSPLVVHTSATTTFEINGTPMAGAAGLALLATLPANTITAAFGTLQTADQSFTATTVFAGSSVEGGFDHMTGSVVARRGNTLTVHGARMNDHDGGDNDDFIAGNTTVTIAVSTRVTVQGQSSATPAHGIAEISVGSLIDAFGTASRDNAGKLSLDATAGRVRLDFTHVQGALSSSSTGNITLNLKTIDHQPVSLFSFTGTGSATGVDTNPHQYVVTTGALDLSQFALGGSVVGIGFVNPFGATPPDFTAVTLAGLFGDDDNDACIDNSGGGNGGGDGDGNGGNGNGGGDGNGGGSGDGNGGGSGDGNGNGGDGNGNGNSDGNNGDCGHVGKRAQMDIDWSNSGATMPFKALSAADLDLDVSNASIGSKHRIQVDPQDVDIRSLSSDLSITGSSSGMTLYAIAKRHGGATYNFASFSDFEAALAADLDGTTTALRLTADGAYDSATNTFTAQRITILLSN
jgi:hypothetical protein